MTDKMVHRLIGYDRETEELAWQHDIPEAKLTVVKKIAKVDANDSDAIGSYELTASQAREIAGIIQQPINTRKYIFYLEPFAAALTKQMNIGRLG
jgi:hypothetical protein